MKMNGLEKGSAIRAFVITLLGVLLLANAPKLQADDGETKPFTLYKGHKVHFRVSVDGSPVTMDAATSPIRGLSGKDLYRKVTSLMSSHGDPSDYTDITLDEAGQLILKGHRVTITFLYMAKPNDKEYSPISEGSQIIFYRKVRAPILAREESKSDFVRYDFKWKAAHMVYYVDGKGVEAKDLAQYGDVQLLPDVMEGKQVIPNLAQATVGELEIGAYKVRLSFLKPTGKNDDTGRPVYGFDSWATNDYLVQKLVRQNELTAGKRSPIAPPPTSGPSTPAPNPPITAPEPPTDGLVGPAVTNGPAEPTLPASGGNGAPAPGHSNGNPIHVAPPPGQAHSGDSGTTNRPTTTTPSPAITIPDANGAGPTVPGQPIAGTPVTPKPSPFPRRRTLRTDGCGYQFQEQSEGVFAVFLPAPNKGAAPNSLTKLFTIAGNLKSVACEGTNLAFVADRILRESELKIALVNATNQSNVDMAEADEGAVQDGLYVLREEKLVLLRRIGPSGSTNASFEKVTTATFPDGASGFRAWAKGTKAFTVDVVLSPTARVRADLWQPAPSEPEFFDANP